MTSGWSRRHFLGTTLRAFGGVGLGVHASTLPCLLPAATAAPPTASAANRAAAITGDPVADFLVTSAAAAILPAGGSGPSAEEAGVAAHLAVVAAAPEFAGLRALWKRGALALDDLARQQAGQSFAALAPAARGAVLADCLRADDAQRRASTSLPSFVWSLLEFTLEGYFGHPRHAGNRDGMVWRAYGLEAMLNGAHAAHAHTPRAEMGRPAPAADDAQALARAWDVIVIGSGAGGAALAWRLAARGVSVLVLEKGRRIAGSDGNLLHDEIAVTRRNLLVPYVKDEPHVVARPGRAAERQRDGWTACCVGGGTVHMSAMLPRMPVRDFAGAAGQAAWPFGAGQLAPYYDLVERELGVSGDRAANPFDPGGPPYALPPIAAHPASLRIAAALRAAGRHPYPTPRGILPRAYRGRSGCVYCPFCAGYACEAAAKASADATFLALAERSGFATVVAETRVTAIRVAGERADGVDLIDRDGLHRWVRAKVVVLAAGAVESARLALLSACPSAPKGIGNGRGQVGGNLTGSYNAGLAGRFDYPSEIFAEPDDRQPFLNIALQDLCAAGGAPSAGMVVIDRRPVSPINQALLVATDAAARGTPLIGAPLKERLFLELARSRSVAVESFIPMRPHPERRVTLDATATDAWQLPAARITFARFADDGEPGRRVVELGERALRGAGAVDCGFAVELEETPFLLSGTMRMGADAATSVTDPHGRVHGMANVYVCDGGALPGMGGVPPTLTIMANAVRIADVIAGA